MVDKYQLIGAVIKAGFIAAVGGVITDIILNTAHVNSPYKEMVDAAISWAIFGGIVYHYYRRYKADESSKGSDLNDSSNSNLDRILKQVYRI
ncbi:MAG: hypothetical protein OH318_01095 [Candidatus Parvarchaeota archaeon]|nr:hypothetical protein [Candidatus Rehaiarchaeum fermentans]MCW1293683.1 hypothetical protein [Candidatus Rehaiarchaeum fermentans]